MQCGALLVPRAAAATAAVFGSIKPRPVSLSLSLFLSPTPPTYQLSFILATRAYTRHYSTFFLGPPHATPRHRDVTEPDPYTSTATERMLTILCLIYCFWVVVLSARAWWWGVTISEKLRSSRRVQFFLAASFVTMVLLLPAIILEYLQPRVRGAFVCGRGVARRWSLFVAVLRFRVFSFTHECHVFGPEKPRFQDFCSDFFSTSICFVLFPWSGSH